LLARAMIAAIRFYQKGISPLKPPVCRFMPTCSHYGAEAIERYGAGARKLAPGEAPGALPPVLPRRLGPRSLTAPNPTEPF
jgi:hypothetical protein